MSAAKIRRRIVAETGDYALANGSPEGDDSTISQVLLRLRMRRGSCAVRPDFGSRLYLIDRVVPGCTARAEDYAREALRDLVLSQRIRDLTVTASIENERSGAVLALSIRFKDSSNDQRTVRFNRKVGE
jgi:phage gp46-like protein